jgi:hypothetical protein
MIPVKYNVKLSRSSYTAIIAALGNMGVKAVGDAYEGVKALVLRKFGADSDLADAVKKLEKQPDAQARQLLLKEELEAAGADKDEEIIKAAQALLDAVKAQPGGEEAVRSIVNQQVSGDHSKAIAVSGGQNVNITA